MPVIRTLFHIFGHFCHILVISLSKPNLKKDTPGIYQISKRYAKPQKDKLGICPVYLFWFAGIACSCHMPCISLSKLFPVLLNAAANEIQPVIGLLFDFCIPLHSVYPAQQDLFATCAPTGSFARFWGGRRRRRRRLPDVLLCWVRQHGGRLRRGRRRRGRRLRGLIFLNIL